MKLLSGSRDCYEMEPTSPTCEPSTLRTPGTPSPRSEDFLYARLDMQIRLLKERTR